MCDIFLYSLNGNCAQRKGILADIHGVLPRDATHLVHSKQFAACAVKVIKNPICIFNCLYGK